VLLELFGRELDAGDHHDGSTCDDDQGGDHDGDHGGRACDDQHSRNDDRSADDYALRSRNTRPVPAGRGE
jgi:hypothetical protein